MARVVREAGPSRGEGGEAGALLFLRRGDQRGGEVQMAEQKRRQRIQELETLVAMLGESENLENCKQKATEELDMLKKTGVDKRPLAQQVASTDIWIKREEIRIRKNQEEMDKGLQALERQKAHSYEEKVRREKLKA